MPAPNFVFMASCTFHPQFPAVEQCEICERPLCGQCLWYGELGHRYCADHARDAEAEGQEIFPPEAYAEGVAASLKSRPLNAPFAPYQGNTQDLYALAAAAIGIITISSCVGGIYCLPLLGLILGILAYTKADAAVDPQRTRLMAGIGIAITGFLLLAIIAIITIYIALFGLALSPAFTSP